ncbi:MAG: hypothetical protein FJ271_08365 [Planctomycetes bacterium]|nr:hypothetical protein [Planctomycetota bacterium]
MTEQTYWTKLTKIGWLKYVPKQLHAEIRDRFKKGFKSSPDWVHLALNQTALDSECIDGPESYCELLKNLAKDSNDIFQPTQIKAEMVKKGRTTSISVSFRHKGKVFSCVVPFETDWFEQGVLDVVNHALEASGREERFIVLPTNDQLMFLVIVPPAVYDKAVESGLIPADEMFE